MLCHRLLVDSSSTDLLAACTLIFARATFSFHSAPSVSALTSTSFYCLFLSLATSCCSLGWVCNSPTCLLNPHTLAAFLMAQCAWLPRLI